MFLNELEGETNYICPPGFLIVGSHKKPMCKCGNYSCRGVPKFPAGSTIQASYPKASKYRKGSAYRTGPSLVAGLEEINTSSVLIIAGVILAYYLLKD